MKTELPKNATEASSKPPAQKLKIVKETVPGYNLIALAFRNLAKSNDPSGRGGLPGMLHVSRAL